MAVSKTIVSCTPYINSSNKVDKWTIEMKYENDSEGDSTYYTTTFSIVVPQLDDDGSGYITASGSHYGSYIDLSGEKAKDDKKKLLTNVINF